MSSSQQPSLFNVQQQIKQNAEELSDYLKDLRSWTKDMNEKKSSSSSTATTTTQRKLPPVRNSAPSDSTSKPVSQQQQQSKPLIEEYDDDAKALTFKNEGNEFFRNKNFAKAIESYNKSLRLKEDPILYCNRSAAQFQLKNYTAAELDSSKAITLDHSYAKAYARRGFARRELSNFEGALQDFERTIALDPSNKEAQREAEKVRKMLEQKRKEEREKQPKKRMVIEEIDEEEEKIEAEKEEEIEEFVTPSATKLNYENRQNQPDPTKAKEQQKPTTQPVQTKSQPKTTPIPTTKTEPVSQKQPEQTTKSQPVEQKSQAKPATVKPAAKKLDVPKIRVKVPTNPPTSSYEFEKVFNELEKSDFYEYLKIIPPASFTKIFKESLNAQILVAIVDAIEQAFLKSEELANQAFQFLSVLTKVNRFDMIVMFLADDEKQRLDTVFQELGKLLPTKQAQIKQVHAKYQ